MQRKYTSGSISILGCGWLGTPLAQKLLADGFSVKGSTTNQAKLEALCKLHVNSVLLNLEAPTPEAVENLISAEILIIAVPASKIPLDQLAILLKKSADLQLKQIILISSTGIYRETNSEIDEADETALDKSSHLFAVEKVVRSFSMLNPVILRLGGLMGYDRHPLKFAKSAKTFGNPNGRINFIHQDDAVEIIRQVILSGITNEIFNCCADEHPTKKEFYTTLAEMNHTPAPVFENVTNDSFKIISNQKVKTVLNFEFRPLYYAL